MVWKSVQLSCWRARPFGISSVRCVGVSGMQGEDLLLVASLDCTVSLWSLKGGLVGVMGKHTWSLSDPSTWQDPKVGQCFGLAFVQCCPQSASLDAEASMPIVILLSTSLCKLGHTQAIRCGHFMCLSISL